MKIIAILDFVSEDDGMVVVKTGCADGNGIEVVEPINSKQCAHISEERIEWFVKNWDLYSKSFEYPLVKMFINSKQAIAEMTKAKEGKG